MTMRRRSVLGLGVTALMAWIAVFAQPTARTYRIGFLTPRSAPVSGNTDAFSEAFERGLRERGYVAGQNLRVEWRYADGNYERLNSLADELVRLNLELIVVYGTAAAVALKRVAGTLPIVITAAVDPVGSKLVDSLARPGSNVTGLSAIGGDLSAKHLELLKTLLPTLASVGVLTHPDNPAHLGVIENVRAAAQQLGIVVVPVSARAPNEIDAAFAAMVHARAGAAIVATDAFFSGQGQRLAGLSIRHRIPTISTYREHVIAGTLMSYGQNIAAFHALAATYVDRILKGAKPADLPMEQPTRMELLIRRSAAKSLKLAVPQELLLRANEVIE